MIVGNDATVKGGTYYPLTVKSTCGLGHRPGKPPAMHLPGGLRRRQPAAPGRGVPRPRALRPDLLQPGQHECPLASRRSPWSWVLHRRRGLRAGDVRRNRDGARTGHHLPRRAAAGEGRYRQRWSAPRNLAAPTCTARSPGSPTTMPRTMTMPGHRPPLRRQPQLAQAGQLQCRRPRTAVPRRGAVRGDSRRQQSSPTTCAK